MQTYIAILRGINVSGKNMIKMPELQTLFEGLGFNKVKTYIQSGNVIFKAAAKNSSEIEKLIEEKIFEKFSLKVPVLVKTKDEVDEVLQNNPFVKATNVDVSKLHATFLSKEPEQANIDKISKDQYLRDEFILKGSTIYLHCPNGYGNTKLNNNFFESKLKVTATTRNWKTVNELANIANSL
jgi:uncharacterized protein (DUF1697 family)